MAAAKAFLLTFLLLISLALIPYETSAARDLLEVKDKAPVFVTRGALAPKAATGKPYTPGCRNTYCRGRNLGPPPGP
ncbi:hypothetical protein MRB53_031389 [Persea americana]|uniref:Uncharacterized protein n=1 Tax=Persea americana TaxID=3435 RepID=A0ACC2KNY4_PERAE|nr:hypothetical protein MRB53_031389 [Persea americana]